MSMFSHHWLLARANDQYWNGEDIHMDYAWVPAKNAVRFFCEDSAKMVRSGIMKKVPWVVLIVEDE